MPVNDTTEKRFESDIESFFLSAAGGYTNCEDEYDPKLGLYTDTLIRYPEGVTSDNDGYGLNQGWSFGNQLISYAWETVGTDDYYEEMKAFNESAVTSKAVGFIFDSSPVKSEVAALDSVLAEYRLGLENGELDPEEYLPKFQQALREAGIEKVIAEKQRQLDAWVAAQS